MGKLVRVDRVIRGEPDHVRNALTTTKEDGRLVGVNGSRVLRDGRIEVSAAILEPSTRSTVRAVVRQRRLLLGLAVAGVAVGAVAGVAYLLWLLVQWVIAHLAAILGAVIIGGAITWWVLGKFGACPGFHCPGCNCKS